MNCLVRSSELFVGSKRGTVQGSEIRGTWRPQPGRNGVGRKSYEKQLDTRDYLKNSLLRNIVIFFVCIIGSPIITLAYGSDTSLRTQNSKPAEIILAQAGEPKTVSSPSPFDDIKKAYADVKTLETQFNQNIYISSLKKERESKGEFFFKRQKGFLWRYKTPKVQYFLYDGKFIWQGEDDKPFVTKDKIDKEKTGGTFFDLVEDVAKIDELFTIKEQKVIGDTEVLELLPKKEGTVNSAKVWIDKQKKIKKIEIHEFTGNINTIEFSAIKVNQPLDDGKFVFKNDGKKEIIER